METSCFLCPKGSPTVAVSLSLNTQAAQREEGWEPGNRKRRLVEQARQQKIGKKRQRWSWSFNWILFNIRNQRDFFSSFHCISLVLHFAAGSNPFNACFYPNDHKSNLTLTPVVSLGKTCVVLGTVMGHTELPFPLKGQFPRCMHQTCVTTYVGPAL